MNVNNEMQDKYPLLYELSRMSVTGVPWSAVVPRPDYKIPDKFKEKVELANTIATKYEFVEIGDVWKDMPDSVECVEPKALLLDWLTFPEAGEQELFYSMVEPEIVKEIKVVDDILYEMFDGELTGYRKIDMSFTKDPKLGNTFWM